MMTSDNKFAHLRELYYRLLDGFENVGMPPSALVETLATYLEDRLDPNPKALAAMEEAVSYLELDEEGATSL